MNPRDYDPQVSLTYLELLGVVLNLFRDLNSQEDLVRRLGATRLTDITELPEQRAIRALDPLPAGFLERVYQFRDASLGRGAFDAVFRDAELVNFRAQLFFGGWSAVRKARQFLWGTLIPALQAQLGEQARSGRDYCVFHKDGIQAVARHVPNTASVSTYFMDERYVGRSPF